MSIYALKPRFQNLLRPGVRYLHGKGVTANQVTLAACAVSVLLGVVLALAAGHSGLFWLLPVWLFVRMALNAVDGMLAREFGQQSALGGYLNEITDVVADAALYLPFAFVAPFGGLQIGLLIFVAAMSEFCGVLGQVHGNGRRYDGPLGKSDRAFIFGALGLWYALAGSLPGWLNAVMWLLLPLLLWTCWRRIHNGLKAA
ncbi:CDP-alcohol phosphatidyltransferase family protein [Paralysiella testudinis]|uniref:CDP-alcohol phosphatidyltransferase family protein n=1 Tax=Paralysiella testudinis TaxID=2809020 RepID=A0A892ZIB3_9NEIS|nr:CDP-alcohol phosphatidyltransferase family protein [Paralysiella testudinis]QRQ82220.1 CDP-alcohol phosphatidyltransferase family protein [Paralysiella testudinis]